MTAPKLGKITAPKLGKIKDGRYNGFIITQVKKGWVKGYYPCNVTESCNVENATTSLRWCWL